jgi:hypothetical protein
MPVFVISLEFNSVLFVIRTVRRIESSQLNDTTAPVHVIEE